MASRSTFSASSYALQLQVGLAELHQERRPIDLELEAGGQHLERLGRLALLHVDVAELEVGPAAARVELLGSLEADDRLVDLAGGAVGQCQVVGRLQVIRIEGQGLLVGGDRLDVPAGLGEDVAEPRIALDHLGIDGQCVVHLGQCGVVALGLRVVAGLLQQVVERDGVFGIAARPVLEVTSRGRADVAEGAQPLLGGRVDRLRSLGGFGPRRLRDQGAQRPLHPVGPRLVGPGQVGLLAGIPAEVVELPGRREDELVGAVAHRLQLAPAVVVARIPATQRRPAAPDAGRRATGAATCLARPPGPARPADRAPSA